MLFTRLTHCAPDTADVSAADNAGDLAADTTDVLAADNMASFNEYTVRTRPLTGCSLDCLPAENLVLTGYLLVTYWLHADYWLITGVPWATFGTPLALVVAPVFKQYIP